MGLEAAPAVRPADTAARPAGPRAGEPVRILHTSDWLVGKTIRGESRIDEHRAVLAEIGEVARAEGTELILVAGDLYETAAPGPESVALVNQDRKSVV